MPDFHITQTKGNINNYGFFRAGKRGTKSRRQISMETLPTVPQEEKRVFHTLDAMRGAAAIIVVIHHLGPMIGGIDFPNAYLAVDFFFGLSGFVIASAYDRKFSQRMTTAQFMLRRVTRLYPLYLLGISIGLISLLLSLAMNGASAGGFMTRHLALSFIVGAFSSLFFLPTPLRILSFASHPFPFDFPSWSLFFELVANWFYAVTYTRLNPWLSAVLIAICGVILGIVTVRYGDIDFGWKAANFFVGIPRVLFSFFIGLALYRYRSRFILRSAVHPLVPLALVVAALVVPLQGQAREVYSMLAILVVFPLIILLGANADQGAGKLDHFFSYLGISSYALYVLHVPLSMLLFTLCTSHITVVASVFSPVIGVLIVLAFIGLSILLNEVYDKPVREKVTRLFFRR